MKSGVSRKKSTNDLLLELIGTNMPDEIPLGWMSPSEMSKESGLSVRTMENRLRTLINHGKVQRKQFRIKIGKETRSVWHYAPTT